MSNMKSLPGFPLEAAGTRKYDKTEGWLHEHIHLTALGRLLETTILDALGPYSGDEQQLLDVIRESARSSRVSPFIDTVLAVRVAGLNLEIEYTAVGYSDRLITALRLDGQRETSSLRRIAQPTAELETRHDRRQTPEGMVCVVEVGDDRAAPLSRVTVSLEYDSAGRRRPYDAEHAIREVEVFARRIARKLAARLPVLAGRTPHAPVTAK